MTGGDRHAAAPAGHRSPAHGFCDDEETRRLLRSRPPRRALAWAGARLGGPVTSARALRGGMSSAVHLVTVQEAGGQRRQAVLRRYVRSEDEPGIAGREARALRFAGSLGVPVPALLAVDLDGTRAGAPAVLMSRLPGRITWWPSDLDAWLARMAEVLARIHAAPPPPPGTIRGFVPEVPVSYQPPAWTRRPRVWQRAAAIFRGPAPAEPAVPLHGDFHPGNVLWRRGRVSGVVDWQAASTGPAVADVAHCRLNLLTFGPADADRFTRLWERAAGTSYHPWGDVVTITGFLDDLRDDWGSDGLLVEDMLARAVAELGADSVAERLRRPPPGQERSGYQCRLPVEAGAGDDLRPGCAAHDPSPRSPMGATSAGSRPPPQCRGPGARCRWPPRSSQDARRGLAARVPAGRLLRGPGPRRVGPRGSARSRGNDEGPRPSPGRPRRPLSPPMSAIAPLAAPAVPDPRRRGVQTEAEPGP